MPTATITVVDAPTGSEVATQSFAENALTKHVQRFAEDQRLTGVGRSALLSPTGSGESASATPGVNIVSIRHFTANPDAYITQVDVGMRGTSISPKMVPIQMKRATAISGGILLALAESANEMDTGATVPLLEFRIRGVLATEAGNALWTFGLFSQSGIAAQNGAYLARSWIAQDRSEWIRLTGDEGIIFDYPIASGPTAAYSISVTWREA